MAITKFKGENRFLSNFEPVWVEFEGKEYPSTEHAYQAAKTLVEEEREKIRLKDTAAKAKRAGKTVTMRPDWDKVKLQVMEELIRQKFQRDDLAEKLLATGDQELVEGNTWGDTFWGVCKGKGENNLGQILMKVRNDLKVALSQSELV